MDTKREYSLDALKVFAITIILFHHYQQGTGAVFKYVNFWDGKFYCGYFVELFFIISGYFCIRYVQKIEMGLNFKKYLIKKIQRLLPLLALSVCTEAFMLYCYNRHEGLELGLDLWQIFLNSIGVQIWGLTNTVTINGPTWYLSVLLLCYIIFYLLVYWARRIKVPYSYLYIILIFIGIAIETYNVSVPFLNGSIARGYMAFFTGVLLAQYLEKFNQQKKKIELVSYIIFLSSLILIIFKYEIISNGISYLMTFLIFPSLIIIIKSKWFDSIFNHKFIGTLGKITFGVYIWHEPLTVFRQLGQVVFSWDIDLNRLSSMILFAIAAWAVGTISYFLLEKPLQVYLDKK